MSVVVAGLLAALVVAVVVFGRWLVRVGPAWVRPAHAPLWLVAGALVIAVGGVASTVIEHPARLLSDVLGVAAGGPGARLSHLALALASLIMMGALVRMVFAIVRRRRLDRGPVPGLFLLAGVGPDGLPLRAMRARVFVAALVLAITVAALGAWAPPAFDTTLWACLVAALTASALAFAPWPAPRVAAKTAPELAAPAALDTASSPPDPTMALVVRDVLAGKGVLWVAPDRAAVDHAITRFARAPEAVFLPPLHALDPRGLQRLAADPYAPRPIHHIEHIVIEGEDHLTGAELAAVREAIATLAPEAELTRVARAPLAAQSTSAPHEQHPHADRRRAVAPPTPRPLVPPRAPVLGEAVPASLTTPIRTTRIRVVATPTRARHRFRGPSDFELWSARVEVRRIAEGERLHGPDQARAHTRLATLPEAAPKVVDARVLVLPTADPIVMHTLTHVVRELMPWFFRDATNVIGVTSATASELDTQGHAALVVHDLDHEGPASGAVQAIAERDWEALLSAARTLLADCDCASHCARCCESTTCTSTPHNTHLDRHRALAVLDALLVARPLTTKKVA